MFEKTWMENWQKLVNNNGPMSWIGKHMTTNLLFGFGETEYVVEFHKGKIAAIESDFNPETCYQLAIKGPAESWAKFCQEVPPPMYNDIWAMAHPLHGRLTLEGDQMVLWQNMRALCWALDRMREI